MYHQANNNNKRVQVLELSTRVCIPGSSVTSSITLGRLHNCFVLHAFMCKFEIITVLCNIVCMYVQACVVIN